MPGSLFSFVGDKTEQKKHAANETCSVGMCYGGVTFGLVIYLTLIYATFMYIILQAWRPKESPPEAFV